MKSTVLTHTIFIFFSQLLLAQPGFNLVVDLGLPINHLKEMIVQNDTIIGYGLAQTIDSVNWQQGLLLVKFDSSGNLLQHKILLDSLGDHYTNGTFWGNIIATEDGGYALTAAAFYRESAFFIKLANDFEVEFIREFNDTFNLNNYNYKLFETIDGYLLYGSIQRPNFLNNAFIQKLDKTGETLWFKYTWTYDLISAYNGGAKINDSLFVLVGGREISTGAGASFIDVVNINGDVLKTWNSAPWPDIGFLRKVIVLPNSDFIVYGQHWTGTTPFGTNLYNSAISRMDTNFQVQSTYYYGEPLPLTGGIRFWGFTPTPDGYFAGAGKGRLSDGSGRNAGWLMKFDEHGDSLWTQHVLAPLENPSHYLGGVGVLSSGNIVAGGEAVNGQQQYIWLVKVTPDGCLDTLWCSPIPVIVEVASRETGLRVFPNPVAQTLIVEPGGTFGEGTLRLIDLQGRAVITQALPLGSNRLSLEVGGLPPGIYFLQTHQIKGRSEQVKIIVTR